MILISATNTLRTTAIHRLVLVSEIILSMTKFLQKLPFVDIIYHVNNSQQCICASYTSGYLDLVQRLEFGVDNLQKNAVYQIE